MVRQRSSSEGGAVFIHVAIGLVVLLAFSAFVLDYGVLWVSRSQAQAAADAGALAGAEALAFDAGLDPSDRARNVAWNVAIRNGVWGAQPGAVPVSPYTGSPCSSAPSSCIRVDTYRNGTNGSGNLPMFFGTLFSTSSQGVRAMAVAQAGSGNASECLKPWGVADKWVENNPVINGTWDASQSYDPTGLHPDSYTAPSATDPGSGFTLANDLGTEIALKVGDSHDTINPGWFQALDLQAGNGSGGSAYRANINSCAHRTFKLGDTIEKENGNMVGPTGQGTTDLIDLDPTAAWDPVNKKVINSCVGPPYTCSVAGYTQTPRIVAIPIFDLAEYVATGGPGSGTVKIVNILGFFVDRVVNPQNTVYGYLSTTVSLKIAAGDTIDPDASFARIVQLVR